MLYYFLKVVELRKRKWENQAIPGSRSGQRPDDISVGSVTSCCYVVLIGNIWCLPVPGLASVITGSGTRGREKKLCITFRAVVLFWKV
jgi:hypothetical protein